MLKIVLSFLVVLAIVCFLVLGFYNTENKKQVMKFVGYVILFSGITVAILTSIVYLF